MNAADRLRDFVERAPEDYVQVAELIAATPALALWAADVYERLLPLRSHPLAARALERLEEIVP